MHLDLKWVGRCPCLLVCRLLLANFIGHHLLLLGLALEEHLLVLDVFLVFLQKLCFLVNESQRFNLFHVCLQFVDLLALLIDVLV